jgi:hypothetical protein
MTKQKEKKTKKKCPKPLTRSQATPAAFLPENKKNFFEVGYFSSLARINRGFQQKLYLTKS